MEEGGEEESETRVARTDCEPVRGREVWEKEEEGVRLEMAVEGEGSERVHAQGAARAHERRRGSKRLTSAVCVAPVELSSPLR